MKLIEFKKELFDRGRQAGFSQMEIYQNESRSFDLRVFEQEIDHYSINEDEGYSFRGNIEGKIGYAYTEKLDDSAIDMLLNNAQQNAEILDKKEGEIFSGSDRYEEVKYYQKELKTIKPEEKISLIKSLEKEALDYDERVDAVNYCLYSDLEFENKIINSKGLDLDFKNNIAYIYLSVIVKEDDDVRTAAKYQITQDFNEFEIKETAHAAVDEAVSLLGASTMKTGKYPVILRYDVAADLLSTFSSTFSAERVQKGLSLFEGKLGEKVAAEKVTIIDDPFLEGGFSSSPFDGEGVATRKKNIIKKGELTTYLHNLKTARKSGVESTGNAYRGSHKSSVDIAPTNMYIEPGSSSYESLVSSVEEGVIIVDVQGMHAGANPVSGDFSLSAFGYYIKDGKIERPVEQITISGNYLEMLKNIEMIADDFNLQLPGAGHFGSPSLKIESLEIAGK
jgi:PmbA protein